MGDRDEQVLLAVRSGDVPELKALLKEDPTLAGAKDGDGLSALMVAVYENQVRIAEHLLKALGKDLDIFEAAAVGRAERVAKLLDRDSSLAEAWSPDGFTPLHLAAFFGQPEAARVLLDRGAEVNAVSRNRMHVMPLHSAAASVRRAVVEVLLEHGADVNAAQHGGWTPLQEAAANGDADMVRIILEAGADPAVTKEDGKTAIDLARDDGHDEIVKLLEEAAAG